MIRSLFVISLMTIGLCDLQLRYAKSQDIWKPIETSTEQNPSAIWERTIPDSVEPDEPSGYWEVVPELRDQNQPSSRVLWEVLETEDEVLIPPSETDSKTHFTPPSSLEEAEALLGTIPLKPNDYQPLLRLSPLVPTAETLPIEQWRIAFLPISPFGSDAGTGNQNYSINLDIGFKDNLLLSIC